MQLKLRIFSDLRGKMKKCLNVYLLILPFCFPFPPLTWLMNFFDDFFHSKSSYTGKNWSIVIKRLNKVFNDYRHNNILWHISRLWLIDFNAVYLELLCENVWLHCWKEVIVLWNCDCSLIDWKTVKAKRTSFQLKKTWRRLQVNKDFHKCYRLKFLNYQKMQRIKTKQTVLFFACIFLTVKPRNIAHEVMGGKITRQS